MRVNLKSLLRSPLFRTVLGLAISLLTLYLALRNVALDELAGAFRQAQPRWIALALLSVGCNNLAKTFRWRALFGQAGKNIPFMKLFLALMSGQTLNAIYPARIGDLSRALVIGPAGPGRVYTLGTVVLEKIFDVIAYAILFVLLILLMPLPGWVNQSAFTLIVLAILSSAGVALVVLFPTRFVTMAERLARMLPGKIGGYVGDRLQHGIDSLEVVQSRAGLAWLAFWSAAVWVTAILNNHLTLLAMQIRLPLVASLLVLVAIQVGISIPSVPGSIGVFEYICVLALSVFQVEQTTALSFAILLHVLAFLPVTLFGLLAIWYFNLGLARDSKPGSED